MMASAAPLRAVLRATCDYIADAIRDARVALFPYDVSANESGVVAASSAPAGWVAALPDPAAVRGKAKAGREGGEFSAEGGRWSLTLPALCIWIEPSERRTPTERDRRLLCDAGDLAVLAIEADARERERQGVGRLLQAVVEATPLAMIALDEREEVRMWNPAAERLFGWRADEVVGGPDPLVEADRPRSEDDDFDDGVGRTLLRRDGGRVEAIVSHAVVRDEGGRVTGTMRIIADATQRTEARRALQSANAEMTAKNVELQEFAYVASHDLQEPLRKIRAFGDRLESRYREKLGEAGVDYLERIQSAAGRMHDLINSLLAYSRIATKETQRVRVDLNEVVREVVSDLELQLAETGGEVLADKLPPVAGDPVQLREMVQNLVSNSMKFRREGVAPVVRIRAHSADDGMVGIAFEDNGVGFDAKYAERILRPFERLHARGEFPGTGMGLAICRRIAERHGGRLRGEGRPGQGATFLVTLPKGTGEN